LSLCVVWASGAGAESVQEVVWETGMIVGLVNVRRNSTGRSQVDVPYIKEGVADASA